MPSVPVALNHVARSRARARADQRAFSAADNRAAHAADCAADERALGPAVMVPAVTPLREAHASESSEKQYQSDNRGYDSSVEN